MSPDCASVAAGPDGAEHPDLDRLAALACRVLHAPAGLIALIDPDRQGRSDATGTGALHADLDAAVGRCIRAAESGAAGAPDVVPGAPDGRDGPAILGAPVVDADGRVLGALVVADVSGRRWHEEEHAMLRELAASAVPAITLHTALAARDRAIADLATITRREADQRGRVERLFHLAEALSSAARTAEMVGHITRLAGDAVGAVFANVAVLDPSTGELELRHGPALDRAIGERWPRVANDSTTPLGHAIVTGRPVLLGSDDDIRREFPSGADDAERAGLRALVAMPVPGTRAAVGFAWPHPIEFDDVLRQVLSTVASLVGEALSRADLYERDRRIADALQRDLLPRQLTHPAGVGVAAWYEVGTAGLQVGGDWYDSAVIGEGRLVVAVGDVVGRGLEAASAMARLRTAFAALAPTTADVTDLVEQLDRFAADVPAARLSTMIAASYAPADRHLRVITAGHLPAMLRKADGSVEQLPDHSLPLGLGTEASRPVHDRWLGPGDVLVLYTDGLVERRGESIDDGLCRLREALAAVPGTSAQAVCDAARGVLAPDHDDDVAILVLQV